MRNNFNLWSLECVDYVQGKWVERLCIENWTYIDVLFFLAVIEIWPDGICNGLYLENLLCIIIVGLANHLHIMLWLEMWTTYKMVN